MIFSINICGLKLLYFLSFVILNKLYLKKLLFLLNSQQYHEQLSSKARAKPRSPSRSSSSHEEDLGQRLEAKLQAAEKKR